MTELMNGSRPWPLVMMGEAGAGKTSVGLCLLDYAGGLYFTLDSLLEKLVSCLKGNETYDGWHSTMKGLPLTEEKLWSWIEKAPLVVIDEVAMTKNRKETWYGNTRDHFSILKRFLDLREFTPHVVVSNREVKDLGNTDADLYDDRVVSRLMAGTVIRMSGDRRQ